MQAQSNDTPLEDVERDHFAESNSWDISRAERAEVSERRAWRVATGAGVLLAIATAAVAVMASKQSVEPFLMAENPETGAPSVITRLADVVLEPNEARDGYWIGRYIHHRETYDWNTLQADYDAVGLLSSGVVGAEYAQRFTGDEALQERWGSGVRATVDVATVVPGANNTATVRFTKTTRNSRGGEPTISHWIATLAFRYDTKSRMTTEQRRASYLGFKVTSYRVDPEISGGGA